jgi:adenosylcobinamide kinase/adenosylcobinamide-phosphate guanylyltransferase
MVPLTFILGGARSGKSARAQTLAEQSGRAPIMIATAQAFDAEMHDRITKHQSERGPAWATIEAPIDLAAAIGQVQTPATIVIDCLTLWVTNLLMADIDIPAASTALLSACQNSQNPIIMVTNETGFGIVPPDPLSRRFRDEAGHLHQLVAAAADEVTLMVAGLPLAIKTHR